LSLTTSHVQLVHVYAQLQVKDFVARFAKAEDVAALEEKDKHGGGEGEGMSEDEEGEWI
jgi:hypothetical protein